MTQARNKNGQFISTGDPIADAEKRKDEAKALHGFNNLQSVEDFCAETSEILERFGLKKPNEKVDAYGFTEDFYRFMNFGRPRDYAHPIQARIADRVDDMRGMRRGMRLDSTTQAFYTPIDDMYGTATGYDTWHDQGRVPVSHLMALTGKRLGAPFRACNGVANDVLDNRFEFADVSDMDTALDPKKNELVKTMFGWMRRVRFNRKLVETLDFDGRCGLGHLCVEKFLKETQSSKRWSKRAPGTKPEKFSTFSSYYMTPMNVYQTDVLDYDKQLWKFNGGLLAANQIHESRVYVLEMRREELGLRGLALPELCWVTCMCYLNLQYYVLKSLAQLGNVTIGIQVDREYPTPTEVGNYLSMLNTMKANSFYVLGKGAQLMVQNAIGQLGSGIKDFMEFLKEEMSAAWIIPKNQMFGRSEGGGISGAGAVVTKEDYLGSNISTKQLFLADEIMYILSEICHFQGLDNMMIKFNIDLLKTKEQQLKEKMMEEQVAQQQIITKQSELGFTLYKKQIKLQNEILDVQMKLVKQDPESFLERTDKDEGNVQKGEAVSEGKGGAKAKGDMVYTESYYKAKLDFLTGQYKDTMKLIRYLNKDTEKLKVMYAQNDAAWRNEIKAR